jgi:hypothetical protein
MQRYMELKRTQWNDEGLRVADSQRKFKERIIEKSRKVRFPRRYLWGTTNNAIEFRCLRETYYEIYAEESGNSMQWQPQKK